MDVSGSGRPNASATCGASVINGDGLATERHRRRRVYQKMRPPSNTAPRMPPTTPPAIAPAFELFFEPEPAAVVEVAPALDDVDVDEPADGVLSGLSVNKERKKKRS